MNESLMPNPSKNISPSGKHPGIFETKLKKLFTRQAHVASIEELNPKFRIITVRGEALKEVKWTPGDKVQIQFGGWVQRTYTPYDWDQEEGQFRILVSLNTEGPGTRWASTLSVGELCVLFGPRKSVDLTKLLQPAILFGDETSLGLAMALKGKSAQAKGIKFLFEFSTPSTSVEAIKHLGLSSRYYCPRSEGDMHFPELAEKMRALLAKHYPAQIVLTGKSTSVQMLHKLLKKEGFSSSQLQSRVYWAPGKTGLD
jgi:NADPH-dependent ferric siderophore reductase